MGEEINIIIDNLCNKFGTTIQTLVPEIAKMRIAEDIVSIVICIILLIILYKIIKKVWEYIKKTDDDMIPAILIPFLPFGIIFTIFCVIVIDLVGWGVSPMAKTIEMIGTMIK